MRKQIDAYVRLRSSQKSSVLLTLARSSLWMTISIFFLKTATFGSLLPCTSSSNNLSNSVLASSARCWLRHAMTSVTPSHGNVIPASASPVRGNDGRASCGVDCDREHSSRRQTPKPIPLSWWVGESSTCRTSPSYALVRTRDHNDGSRGHVRSSYMRVI